MTNNEVKGQQLGINFMLTSMMRLVH